MFLKKTAALLLALLMGMSLCACAEKTPEPPQIKIGVCFRENAARQPLQQALEDLGWPVVVTHAGNEQARQNTKVKELLDQGCSLVIVESVMVSALEDVTAMLQQANVPGVFIGNAPEAAVLQSWEKLCYVGYDASQPGAAQAALLARLPAFGDLNGDGVTACVVLHGPENSLDALLYRDSCLKTLREGTVATELLADDSCEWTAESGKQNCAEALSRFGRDIEVILCGSEEIARGAVEAVSVSGRTAGEDVHILCIGDGEETLAQVTQGTLCGTVAEDEAALIKCIAETASALVTGATVEKTRYVDYRTVVTPTEE